MELLKKYNIELYFTFFVTFGYIFFYSFALPFNTLNQYFSVPFRVIIFFLSLYIIYLNWDNVKKRKVTFFSVGVFWIFYLIKTFYSFHNYTFFENTGKQEYSIYIRIICLNLIPIFALLSINFSKKIINDLIPLIFNFLLVILGISFLYVILISHYYNASSGIFTSYYISTGHYGLSLIIISIFCYFHPPQEKIKSIIGVLLGIFTILISSARSPLLAGFVILLILLLYLNKIKYWFTLLIFILIFLGGIYYLKHLSVDFQFIERVYAGIFEGNASGRGYYLLKGWDVFSNNIFFGGRTLFEDGMYPHNVFVEILMSMGLIGLILLFLYFKDLKKFRVNYIKENTYYLPFFLFFVQYLVLVQTSYCIFANMEFWHFSALFISIILFCYDEKIKSNDSRGNTTGDH